MIRINLPWFPPTAYRWYVAPEASSLFVRAGLSGREDRIIQAANRHFERDSKSRTIFFLPIAANPNEWTVTEVGASAENNPRLVGKRFRIPKFSERLKSFVMPSKAEYEFLMHRYLKGKNVPVATPVAFLESKKWNLLQESYLFLTELVGVVNLKDYLLARYSFYDFRTAPANRRITAEAESEKNQFLRKIAELIRSLHNANFYHEDLHLGNILVQPGRTADPLKLYLTDFHRGYQHHLTAQDRINNLGMFVYSLRRILPLSDVMRFLIYYRSLDLRRETIKPFTRQVLAAAERYQFRHWQSRTNRCRKNSSAFAITRAPGLTIYQRRNLTAVQIKELVTRHRDISRDAPEKLFKQTPKRVISLLPVEASGESSRYFIKEYRYRLKNWLGNLLRKHPAKSDWIAHQGLAVRGIRVPESVALVEERFGPFIKRAYLITREIKEALPSGQYALNTFTAPGNGAVKRNYLKEFAAAVCHLHQRGIYHADLKANNIIVKSEISPPQAEKSEIPDWSFYFLDLDRVAFRRQIAWPERMKNLAQLNAATPGVLSRADRLRFFHHYLTGTAPLTPLRRKAIIHEIMRQTIARHHFWPR